MKNEAVDGQGPAHEKRGHKHAHRIGEIADQAEEHSGDECQDDVHCNNGGNCLCKPLRQAHEHHDEPDEASRAGQRDDRCGDGAQHGFRAAAQQQLDAYVDQRVENDDDGSERAVQRHGFRSGAKYTDTPEQRDDGLHVLNRFLFNKLSHKSGGSRTIAQRFFGPATRAINTSGKGTHCG